MNSEDQNQERNNFTFFHEISHHLIRNDDELYSFLDSCVTDNESFDRLIEVAANIGAAEFLVPSQLVRDFIHANEFSMSLLPKLDEVLPASKPAIAIQLAQCATHQCIVGVCARKAFQKSEIGQLELVSAPISSTLPIYFEYCSSSPSCKYSIKKNSVVPATHTIGAVFESKTALNTQDFVPFGNKTRWKVDCDAIYYKGKVYVAFNLTPPFKKNPYQLHLFP